MLACVAAAVRSPPWLLAPVDTISCRLNRAVMVRTLYCFILFPGCLYYMARPAFSSPPLFSASPFFFFFFFFFFAKRRSAGWIKIKLPRTRAPVLHEGLGDARQEPNFLPRESSLTENIIPSGNFIRAWFIDLPIRGNCPFDLLVIAIWKFATCNSWILKKILIFFSVRIGKWTWNS